MPLAVIRLVRLSHHDDVENANVCCEIVESPCLQWWLWPLQEQESNSKQELEQEQERGLELIHWAVQLQQAVEWWSWEQMVVVVVVVEKCCRPPIRIGVVSSREDSCDSFEASTLCIGDEIGDGTWL